MPLQKNVIDIPIVGGVEGNTEGPLRTRLAVLENGVYRKRKGVQKRFGTRQLVLASSAAFGRTVPPALPDALYACGSECLRVGSGELTTFSDSLYGQLGQRVYRDQISTAVGSYTGIAASSASFTEPDSATWNGLVFTTYRDRSTGSRFGYIYLTVTDAASGVVILDRVRVTTTGVYCQPRVVVDTVAATAVVVYADNTTNLYARVLDLVTFAFGTQTLLRANLDDDGGIGRGVFDVCPVTSGFAVASLINIFASKQYVVETFNAVLAQTAVGTGETGAFAGRSIAIAADASRIWVAYAHEVSSLRTVRFQVWNAVPSGGTLSSISSAAPIEASTVIEPAVSVGLAIVPGTPNQCAVIATRGDFSVWSARVDDTGGVSGPRITQRNFRWLSKPWFEGGIAYALVLGCPYAATLTDATKGCTVFVLDTQAMAPVIANAARPVVTMMPRQASTVGVTSSDQNALATPLYLNGSWRIPFATSLTAERDGVGTVYAASVTFGVAPELAQIGDVAMFSGGVPSTYDGSIVSEAGFLQIPTIVGLTTVSGSGSLSAGSYQYILVYEWTDARGNLHRSAPSVPVTVAPGASNRVTVEFSHLTLTTREDFENFPNWSVACVLYRTKANGSEFHRLTAFPIAIGFKNSAATSSATYTDGEADTTLGERPQLYTTGEVGGVLTTGAFVDNVCPPTARFVVAHQTRFWLAGTDEDSIWYSKTLLDGEGPAFNEALTVPAFEGGAVTAIASLDGALVVFKAGTIWVIQGDGNDDTGANGSLSPPQRVSADTGCVNARSVVTVPDGLLFLSQRGIYLLSRSLQVQFLGEDVADLTQAPGMRVTSAVLVPSQNQVRFTLTSPVPTDGVTLIYDYLNAAWSTARYYDTYEAGIRGAAGACVSGGVYRWVTPAGQEYAENTSSYLDADSIWVTMRLTTAWIALSGSLQGYQRVWRAGILGERASAHGVQLSVDVDYVADATQTATFTEAVVTGHVPEQLELRVRRERCSALRVTFTDTVPTVLGTGKGATLDAITLEFGVLPGKSRGLAAAQKG